MIVHNKDDVAALTAVTAVGAAGGDIFFPMEADLAVAALTGFDPDFCNIYKHGFPSLFT